MDLYGYVGKRIRELRTTYSNGQGISQEMLARAMAVSTNTISRWETATYHPTLGELEKLGRFFGVSLLAFIPHEEVPDDDRVGALVDVVRDLTPEDVEEVQRYAEFRKARQLRGGAARPRPGRKPKRSG